MGNRSFRWISNVKDSLCNRFECLLRGKLCSAMFVSGLSRLGRNVLMSVDIVGSCGPSLPLRWDAAYV